jgi:hypothetical protein
MIDYSPASIDASQLWEKFSTANEKNQLQMMPEITKAGSAGVELAIAWFDRVWNREPSAIAGSVYQVLYESDLDLASGYLDRHLPQGVVPLKSDLGLDYAPLLKLLLDRQFEAADKMTSEKLCQLAGEAAMARKWLYFTEAKQLPEGDLQTIDRLWLVHSQGRFGFSVQRQLWLSSGKNWEKLWPKIGWKSGKDWTRYPKAFTWDLTAPIGHLPLSNQLRGVRTMDALLSHPLWAKG